MRNLWETVEKIKNFVSLMETWYEASKLKPGMQKQGRSCNFQELAWCEAKSIDLEEKALKISDPYFSNL